MQKDVDISLGRELLRRELDLALVKVYCKRRSPKYMESADIIYDVVDIEEDDNQYLFYYFGIGKDTEYTAEQARIYLGPRLK